MIEKLLEESEIFKKHFYAKLTKDLNDLLSSTISGLEDVYEEKGENEYVNIAIELLKEILIATKEEELKPDFYGRLVYVKALDRYGIITNTEEKGKEFTFTVRLTDNNDAPVRKHILISIRELRFVDIMEEIKDGNTK